MDTIRQFSPYNHRCDTSFEQNQLLNSEEFMNKISHESKDIKDTAAYLKEIFYLNAKKEIVLEV